MNAKKIKKTLIDRELSIADIARALVGEGQSEEAKRVMISQMINGVRYYPTLARQLKDEFDIHIPRPRPGELQRAA